MENYAALAVWQVGGVLPALVQEPLLVNPGRQTHVGVVYLVPCGKPHLIEAPCGRCGAVGRIEDRLKERRLGRFRVL